MAKLRIIAFFAYFFGLVFTGFGQRGRGIPASGVPYSLARQRASMLKDIRYDLSFAIAGVDTPVAGFAIIYFTLAYIPSSGLPLDFKAPAGAVSKVSLNGEYSPVRPKQEHLL